MDVGFIVELCSRNISAERCIDAMDSYSFGMGEAADGCSVRFRDNAFSRALLKEKFPLSCIVLYSVYGTGANHFVWHARTREELTHAQSSEQILIDAYGEQEGTALWKKWNECLYKTSC